MELLALIRALSDSSAYPFEVQSVHIRQTHISVVFLAGDYVYKIKKPVKLGFLDFSTLEQRRHYCEEELRLNRRLAPNVYLGVAPVVATNSGVQVDASGEIVEWAVKMRRLPDEATLSNRLLRGELSVEGAEGLAKRIAAFHATAERNPQVSSFGSFDVVSRNAHENFEESLPQIGATVSRAVFDRLRKLTDQCLAQNRPLIDRRAASGVPRDTHGDLRLEHVYWFPQRQPPEDYVVIDCIEFNERLRFADPICDMAFLAMDFKLCGRNDLAAAFIEAYLQATSDYEGRELLTLYVAYRAAVRAKVEGMKGAEAELSEAERPAALALARRLWLLGLRELEESARRSCLILLGGLPGTGKSTLAADLARSQDFEVIRSDVVRKEITGPDAQASAPRQYDQGIYAPEWNDRTYDECLRRAEARLFEGRRVIVDASFREDSKRQLFLQAAKRWGAPALFLMCEADRSVVHNRLAKRENDASDADWQIYLKAAQSWEAASHDTLPFQHIIRADGAQEQTLQQAIAILHSVGIT